MGAATSLTGMKLVFDRAGRRLFAIEPDAISMVDLVRSQAHRLPFADVAALAAFDEQLWLARRDDTLIRVDDYGRTLGEPCALAFAAPALLLPAPCGAPAVVWQSAPALAVIDDFGELVRSELAEADLVVPLTGRRHVLVRGSRLVLPSGVAAQLPPGTGVIGGAIASEGKWLVLLVAQGTERSLLVLSIGSGQLLQRCRIPAGPVRIGTGRLVAAYQVDARVIAVLDLMTGRELGRVVLDEEPSDFAIDPTAARLATRAANGSVELHRLAEVLRRPGQTVVVQPDDGRESDVPAADVPPADDRQADVQAPDDGRESDVSPSTDQDADARTPDSRTPDSRTSESRTPFACPVLVALGPRPRRSDVDRKLALEQLSLELRRAQLWALAAIALGWDTRRIGYGNEGKHPFELEVTAILGLNEGHAREHLAAARDVLARHEERIAADPGWRGPATPIGRLVAELGLSERAIDILVVIAAPALWGETARLYGVLANDAGRPVVDELVVQQVLAARHDRHDVAAELEPRAPLVRLGIVQVSARRPRPFSDLTIDPVVLDLLRAAQPALGNATTVRTADRPLAALDLPRGVLETATAALAAHPTATPVRIVVRGRAGSGRKTLLAALCDEAGRELAVIDALGLARSPELFPAELEQALRGAQLAGLVPCVVNLDDVVFGERSARELAAETLRLHPGPIAVITSAEAPAPFRAGHVAITLVPAPETERRATWLRAAAEANIVGLDADLLAARYRVGPGVIRRAVAAAVASTSNTTATTANAAAEDYIRQTRDGRLGQYARRVDRLATWSNIVLPSDILDSLRELVARVRHGRTVFDAWGMSSVMQTSRGLTALFQGPPGTGKTLVAGVIARELGLDLYQVDLSKVMSKWIGETERNLSTIFDAAEDGQVILLFDEADSLFAKRTEVRSSNDRYANLEVNYLLQRVDAFEGIAILTTNSGTSIDQAFKRRMSFRLSFPFPDEETREQLWRAHLPPGLPVEGKLALDVLARKYQLAGGYIRNACLRAAFLAAQEETRLHQRHLERAVALEYAELGKLSTGGAID